MIYVVKLWSDLGEKGGGEWASGRKGVRGGSFNLEAGWRQ